MDSSGFEAALARRAEDMLDACTRCGACFAACPITGPAGLADADPATVVSGMLDLVRLGEGPVAARKWAAACMLSGECVRACDYGVNPRFLLAVARVRMAGAAAETPELRRRGVESFRGMSRDVAMLSRLQLTDEALERLGQRPSNAVRGEVPGSGVSREAAGKLGSESNSGAQPASRETPGSGNSTLTPFCPDPALPDVVFYTGCNVLKTPHIALLCLDVMDLMGVSYRVMGGPSHCCGILHFKAGDTSTASRFAASTIDKLAQSQSGQVISWCPSCFVQFTEMMLPTFEAAGHARPFDMTPFMLFLRQNLDRLRPLLSGRVPLRVALHKHPGVTGVVEAAEEILRAVPGVDLVDLGQPAVGLQSVNLATMPGYKRQLQLAELEAARAAGVDALAAIYHSDHRELCAHERDWPFRIVNLLEIVGESLGLGREDRYKHLKVMQDADAILADCADLLALHRLDADAARRVIAKGMLEDQPLPLR